MGKTLTEIAQQLKDSDKKVQLIYAFNGTGKTRLSRKFKELIASINDDEHFLSRDKILYYNAFTEDLFYWDNDLEYDIEPKLKIQPNSFINWIYKDEGLEGKIIDTFHRYNGNRISFQFVKQEYINKKGEKEYVKPECYEVLFSLSSGDNQSKSNIKISKSEESIFIWSIFYVLIEQVIETLNTPKEDRDSNKFNQLEYIFIDDPVSSLDENYLIQLAIHLAKLIKSSKSQKVKFIITTHNTLFYNVLFNELNLKGQKNGCYLLKALPDGTFELKNKRGDSNTSFSYHLFLKSLLDEAIREKNIQKYHFIFLRNLYEKTANFLGYRDWSQLLPNDENNVRQTYASRIMNFYSHSTLSNETIAEPKDYEKKMVEFLLKHLVDTYHFNKIEQQEENKS